MIPIEVNLINFTDDATNLLIYTKSTRLEQGDDTFTKVKDMTWGEKEKELEYMANTIPSSWEFIDYCFQIRNVSRAFTHQFVRTRTGSYAQQTMRMLNKKAFTYRIPPRLKEENRKKEKDIYCSVMEGIQFQYDSLIASGVEIEDARGILPTNIHTNIIAKFNLRTLSEMARKRTGTRTQDEYREVMEQMLERVLDVHPWAEKFFFPVEKKNFNMLEKHLQDAHKLGEITKEEFYDLNKALDKIKGGAT